MFTASRLAIFSAITIFLLSLFVTLGNFIKPWLSTPHFNLGIDLVGGSNIIVEVDTQYYANSKLDQAQFVVSNLLRGDNVKYGNLHISQTDDFGVVFESNDEIKKIRKAFSGNELFIEKLEGKDNTYIAKYSKDSAEKDKYKLISQTLEVLRNRIDPTGTKEITMYIQGNNKIAIEIPSNANVDQIKTMLSTTAKMTFHLMHPTTPFVQNTSGFKDFGYDILPGYNAMDTAQYVVKRRFEIDGSDLIDAQVTFSNGEPAVLFNFNNNAGRKFASITTSEVGHPFAIVLDGRVISAPMIREPITTGGGVISGKFTTEEAKKLALLLRAGALPAPTKIVQEKIIGPSLGAASIKYGKLSFILAFILVGTVMLIRYRLLGIVSVAALTINVLILLAILSIFGATLTLPGIAGIILTSSMAVDGNVLVFERIREELKKNATSKLYAIKMGFDGAFAAIFDSNLTAMIAGLTIYYFGFGPIRGFATTLCIGIISALFSSLIITRVIIYLLTKRSFINKSGTVFLF